jgi:hypothetical protein
MLTTLFAHTVTLLFSSGGTEFGFQKNAPAILTDLFRFFYFVALEKFLYQSLTHPYPDIEMCMVSLINSINE